MQKNKIFQFTKLSGALLLISFIADSCASTAPVRKKMLNYQQYDAFENANPFQARQRNSNSAYGFTYNETDIAGNDGITQQCISVPFPDASYDAMAISLFESYKILAIPLLTEWAKQSRNGVILDLRANTAQTGSKTEYVIEKSGDFSIPLIFLWDKASEARASSFTGLLNEVPGVGCRKISQ